MVFIKICSELR